MGGHLFMKKGKKNCAGTADSRTGSGMALSACAKKEEAAAPAVDSVKPKEKSHPGLLDILGFGNTPSDY